MSLSIKTNTASLFAYQKLSKNSNRLNGSLEKLSSGLRINKAADDGSGLYIADQLHSQARGLGQAVKNASDAISIAKTADGAIDESIKIVNIIKTKAIQASQDGQTYESRKAIQSDIDKLRQELDHIASSTSFNGQKLLSGGFSNKQFQVGAYTGETVNISIASSESTKIGHTTVAEVIPDYTKPIYTTLQDKATGEDIVIEPFQIEYYTPDLMKDELDKLTSEDINKIKNLTNEELGKRTNLDISKLTSTEIDEIKNRFIDEIVEKASDDLKKNVSDRLVKNGIGALARQINKFEEQTDVKAFPIVESESSIIAGNTSDDFKINGITIGNLDVLPNDSDGSLIAAINGRSSETGVTAYVTATGKLELKSSDGRAIKVEGLPRPEVISSSALTTHGYLKMISRNFGQYQFYQEKTVIEEESSELKRNGIISLISKSSNGDEGDEESLISEISANGDFIVFSSAANNLVANDSPFADIFLYNIKTNEIKLISVATDGTPGDLESKDPSIDSSGRYIAFWSKSENFAPGDNFPRGSVYLHDTVTGITTLIGKNTSGGKSIHGSDWPSISGNGRYVAFVSESDDIILGDDNNETSENDVIMYDTQTDEMILISNRDGDNDPSDGGWIQGPNRRPDINYDGKYVVFQATDPNATGDTDNNGSNDIFLRNTQTYRTTLLSKAINGEAGNGGSINPVISDDGQFVVFESNASDLVSIDNNGHKDIFLHNTQIGKTTLISKSSDGNSGNGGDSFNASISNDGRYIAFASSADNLVENDNNGVADIFRYDTHTGVLERISEGYNGNESDGDSGTSIGISNSPISLSGDGRYVTFGSQATNLIAGSTSGINHVYLYDSQKPIEEETSPYEILNPINSRLLRLCDVNVTTFDDAQIAMELADVSLRDLDKTRSNIGSVQNQLQSTISNITNTQFNATASESSIRDVDFADESRNLSRLQILSESGTFALAQANKSKENLISLLK